MWWIVAILLIIMLFSYKREGMESDDVDDPNVATQLQKNEGLIADLTTKVNKLSSVTDTVDALTRRLDTADKTLNEIASMCVKCST